MFKKNSGPKQISLLDPYNNFPKYVQKALEKSWAVPFYKDIGYFSWINALLVAITRVPLPADKKLSEEDIDKLSTTLLLQVAITLDHEISGLLAEFRS